MKCKQTFVPFLLTGALLSACNESSTPSRADNEPAKNPFTDTTSLAGCLDPQAFAAGYSRSVSYQSRNSAGEITQDSNEDYAVIGPTQYSEQAVIELQVDSLISDSESSNSKQIQQFVQLDTNQLMFQKLADRQLDDSGTTTSFDYSPPVEERFDLEPGQDYAQTIEISSSGESNSDQTLQRTVRYIGRETITLTDGDYDTCVREISSTLEGGSDSFLSPLLGPLSELLPLGLLLGENSDSVTTTIEEYLAVGSGVVLRRVDLGTGTTSDARNIQIRRSAPTATATPSATSQPSSPPQPTPQPSAAPSAGPTPPPDESLREGEYGVSGEVDGRIISATDQTDFYEDEFGFDLRANSLRYANNTFTDTIWIINAPNTAGTYRCEDPNTGFSALDVYYSVTRYNEADESQTTTEGYATDGSPDHSCVVTVNITANEIFGTFSGQFYQNTDNQPETVVSVVNGEYRVARQ